MLGSLARAFKEEYELVVLSHLVLLGLAFGGITTLQLSSCITGLSTFPLFSHEARKIVPVRVNRRRGARKKKRDYMRALRPKG